MGTAAAPLAATDRAMAQIPGRQRMEQAAQRFEEMFLSQILRDFTAGAIGPGGEGTEMIAGMLQDEYARLIARDGGFGIAPQVLRVMLKAQESR